MSFTGNTRRLNMSPMPECVTKSIHESTEIKGPTDPEADNGMNGQCSEKFAHLLKPRNGLLSGQQFELLRDPWILPLG